jgi:hypothetical protein
MGFEETARHDTENVDYHFMLCIVYKHQEEGAILVIL